jgi:hypothetical protein
VSRSRAARPIVPVMSTNPIDSLPPLPPQEMSSILGDSSAVQALGGAGESLPGTGAFLDLSSAALQLTGSQQVQMAELEDDAALFGGAVGSSSAIDSLQPAAVPPVEPQYDPTADVANPAYADQPDTFNWSSDLTNPGFWA